MASTQQITVPDIGDFDDVPVIPATNLHHGIIPRWDHLAGFRLGRVPGRTDIGIRSPKHDECVDGRVDVAPLVIGPGKVALVYITGESDDGTAGIRTPVGRKQP